MGKEIVEVTEQTDDTLETRLYFDGGIDIDVPAENYVNSNVKKVYEIRVNTAKIKIPSADGERVIYETMKFIRGEELSIIDPYTDIRTNNYSEAVTTHFNMVNQYKKRYFSPNILAGNLPEIVVINADEMEQ